MTKDQSVSWLGMTVLTLSSLQINTSTLQTVPIQMRQLIMSPHQDLHCLPLCYFFLTETHICTNGCVQIQRWKTPFQKLRDERVKVHVLILQHNLHYRVCPELFLLTFIMNLNKLHCSHIHLQKIYEEHYSLKTHLFHL